MKCIRFWGKDQQKVFDYIPYHDSTQEYEKGPYVYFFEDEKELNKYLKLIKDSN